MIAALAFISYLIGSVPTGLLVARSKGMDLRTVGSGNIGATNVLRALGKEAAFLTLAGDLAKGAVPVLIVRALHLVPEPAALYEGLVGLAAIMGHNFSIFLRFRGGKGVATSIGVLFAYSPPAALFTVTLWLMTVKWTRFSSLGALVSFGLLPLTIYVLDYSQEKLIIAAVMTAILFIRHAANIGRLLNGTEPRIGQKA